MKRKVYCDICDKYISNKNKHIKTDLHKRLAVSVVNRYHIKIVYVKEIDNVLNEHITDYNKKFLNFVCYWEIQNENFCYKINFGWINRPNIQIGEKLIKRYDCSQRVFVHIKIVFVTDLVFLSYDHYIKQPRQMIERKICKMVDQNPNLIKTLNVVPTPFRRYIIIKNWGFNQVDPFGIICDYVPLDCENLEPNIC